MTALSLSSYRVLAVDDEENILALLTKMLGALGIDRVECARSGAEAVTKLQHTPRPFDFILCDQKMPDGNGLQLLKAIRCGAIRAVRANTSFVFLTGVVDKSLVAKAGELQADGYLIKPVTMDQLRASIVRAKSKTPAINLARYAQVEVPQHVG